MKKVTINYPLGSLSLLDVTLGSIFREFQKTLKELSHDKQKAFIIRFGTCYTSLTTLTSNPDPDKSGIEQLAANSQALGFYPDMRHLIADLKYKLSFKIEDHYTLTLNESRIVERLK